MNLTLRHSGRLLHIVRAADPRAGEVMSFTSVDDARSLVSRLATDERNRSVMRTAMQREALGLDAHRLGDKQVAEQFSRQLVHGRLRLAEDVRPPEAPASVSLAGGAAPDEPAPTQKKTRQKTWIKLKVIDDASGHPISGVRLLVTHPDGEQNYYTTVASGMVEIADLDPGKCDLTCSLKDARLTDTLDFVAMGDKAPAPGAPPPPGGSSLKQIAEIEAHKVKKGESILSLAQGAGMKWQDLAKFNWGTDVPDKINISLRNEVGCTKKTADGKNYMFDDSDDPGIVFIPTKWEKTGLATETTHVIRVRPLTSDLIDLVIPLEVDLDGDPEHADLIRLRSEDASYDAVVSSDDDAATHDEENPLILYRFSDVPPGVYEVAVNVAGDWHPVLAGLRVTRTGVTHGGKAYESEEDGSKFGNPEDDLAEDAGDDPGDDVSCTH